jgi:outer membrane protein OmpA-like peptidoglycan-associated protein
MLVAMAVVTLGSAFAASCGFPPSKDASVQAEARPALTRPAVHIAQLDFGRQAAFASCMPPACPEVTQKTLASDTTAPQASRPIEPPASLNRDESLVAGEPDTPAAPAPDPERWAALMSKRLVVHFAFGSAALSAGARALIEEAVGATPFAERIAIRGRTDNVGSPQANQMLAADRANAVRDHLRARHPQLAPVVTLEAKGACCFAAPNDTPQGRALNRRVELVFERDAEDL